MYPIFYLFTITYTQRMLLLFKNGSCISHIFLNIAKTNKLVVADQTHIENVVRNQNLFQKSIIYQIFGEFTTLTKDSLHGTRTQNRLFFHVQIIFSFLTIFQITQYHVLLRPVIKQTTLQSRLILILYNNRGGGDILNLTTVYFQMINTKLI